MATPSENDVARWRRSGVRMGVSFASVTVGQLALGANHVGPIMRNAGIAAVLAEATAQLLRWSERESDLERPLDPLLLASYGERELERIYNALRRGGG